MILGIHGQCFALPRYTAKENDKKKESRRTSCGGGVTTNGFKGPSIPFALLESIVPFDGACIFERRVGASERAYMSGVVVVVYP